MESNAQGGWKVFGKLRGDFKTIKNILLNRTFALNKNCNIRGNITNLFPQAPVLILPAVSSLEFSNLIYFCVWGVVKLFGTGLFKHVLNTNDSKLLSSCFPPKQGRLRCEQIPKKKLLTL